MMPRVERQLHIYGGHYVLTSAQTVLIDTIAGSLGPQGGPFRLQVGSALYQAAPIGRIDDELLDRVIDKVLAEVT
jgi:hypothetical protein